MERKEAYAKKVQAQLDEWDADIKKLRARAEQAEANAQIEYQKQIETLQSKRDSVKGKLADLKRASDDAWEDLKDGLESARDSLGNALKSATARFS
jgi:chromosome segregation ATPase